MSERVVEVNQTLKRSNAAQLLLNLLLGQITEKYFIFFPF